MNPYQQSAIEASCDQPLCILAGPGSGKTRTLIERVVRLVRFELGLGERGVSNNVNSNEIPSVLLLTFSKSAVQELKNRLANQLSGPQQHLVDVHTFHSFSFRMITRNYKLLGFTTYPKLCSYKEGKDILKKLVDRLKNPRSISVKEFNHLIIKIYKAFLLMKVTLSLASMKKSTNVVDDTNNDSDFPESNLEWISLIHSSCDESQRKWMEFVDFRLLYTSFINRIRELNYLHYEDMVPYALNLIKPHRGSQVLSTPQQSILDEIQSKYKFFMCDEFQDTNTLQLELITRIASSGRVTVVGDINQCIYEFQGADYENINRFINHYNKIANQYPLNQRLLKTVNIIELPINYRSHEHIVEAFNSVIHGKMISHREFQPKIKQDTHPRLSQIKDSQVKSKTPINLPLSQSFIQHVPQTIPNSNHIYLTQCSDINSQYEYVLNAISILMSSKPLQLSDIAILYRRNDTGEVFKKYVNQYSSSSSVRDVGDGRFVVQSNHFKFTKGFKHLATAAERDEDSSDDGNEFGLQDNSPQSQLIRVFSCLELILALQSLSSINQRMEALSEKSILNAMPIAMESLQLTREAFNSARKAQDIPYLSNEPFFVTLYRVVFKGNTPNISTVTLENDHGNENQPSTQKRKRDSYGSPSNGRQSSGIPGLANCCVSKAIGLKNWLTAVIDVYKMIDMQIRDLSGIVNKVIEITIPERKSIKTINSKSFNGRELLPSTETPQNIDPIDFLISRARLLTMTQLQGNTQETLFDTLRRFSNEIYDSIQAGKEREDESDNEDVQIDNHSTQNKPKDNRVWVGTIHRAKGLEWEVVFILNASHDEFKLQVHELPLAGNLSSSSIDLNTSDENIKHSLKQTFERQRLLYVALSRAKSEMHISYVNESYSQNQTTDISRFLSNLVTLPSVRRLVYSSAKSANVNTFPSSAKSQDTEPREESSFKSTNTTGFIKASGQPYSSSKPTLPIELQSRNSITHHPNNYVPIRHTSFTTDVSSLKKSGFRPASHIKSEIIELSNEYN